MNLNSYKPKNITEDLLLLITKNAGTLIQQTHIKAQESLEYKLTKSRESFSFDTPLQLGNGEWLLRLTSLEVYNSLFTITNKNTKFKISKPNEKKGKRYSLENFRIDDENFRPEDIR